MGIKKMLHLIWSKDNSSTSEDGKELKGIRSRLLECYRNLYFDPLADMEPKAQVNRIAKNMIEYVCSHTSHRHFAYLFHSCIRFEGERTVQLWLN
jgi:condensin complex subunit 1